MGGLLQTIAEGPRPQVQALSPQDIALKNAQVGAAQQQIQAGALENQQRTMDMADAATTRLYIQKHNRNFETMLQDPDYLGSVQPHTALAIQGAVLKNAEAKATTQKAIADATDAQAKATQLHTELAANTAYALAQTGYSPAAFDAAMVDMEKSGLMDPQHAEALRQMVGQDPTKIKPIVDQLAMQSPLRLKDIEAGAKGTEAATGAQKQQLEQDKDARARGEQAFGNVKSQDDLNNWTETYGVQFPNAPKVYQPDTAAIFQRSFVAPKDLPEYDIKKIQADAMKNTSPQEDGFLVDKVVSPASNPLLNQTTKGQIAAIRSQIHDPEKQGAAIAGVLKDAADQVNAPGKAAATEGATAGIKVRTSVAEKVQGEQALAALAPPEVRGIIDTPTRNKVVTDRIAAEKDHAKATGEAQQLADYVKAAASGNQAAAANVPIAALRSIVNRVNRQELEAQGGQSWARRIEDYAAKGVEGHPSQQTLSDFGALAGISQKKADTVFSDIADSLNAQGAKYPRTAPRAQPAAQPNQPATHRYNPKTGKIEAIQ